MQKPLLEEKEYLTEYEAAEFYNLSRRKFGRLLQKKGLKFLARYVGRPLIIKEEFEKYLAQPGVREGLKNGKPRTKKRLEAQSAAQG